MANGRISPLAWAQAIHDRVDGAYGVGTIQLAAPDFIVGRRVLRDKLGLVHAGDVTLIDLLRGGSRIVVEIGGLSSWLG